MSEDYENNQSAELSRVFVLSDIEKRLAKFHRCLKDFGLPLITDADRLRIAQAAKAPDFPPLIATELGYSRADMEELLNQRVYGANPSLTPSQMEAYNVILTAVTE